MRLISGHRRKRGCELCGKDYICQLLSETIRMMKLSLLWSIPTFSVKTYCQVRKAHAYKMKYDAMKHQGSKGEKYTADMVGEAAGDSGRTVQRYIRLAALSDGSAGICGR